MAFQIKRYPTIMKNNFHLISIDPKLSNIFKDNPTEKAIPFQITFWIQPKSSLTTN